MQHSFKAWKEERSGQASILEEQDQNPLQYPPWSDHDPNRIGVPLLIHLSDPEHHHVRAITYSTGAAGPAWLTDALSRIDDVSAGADNSYAKLAVRQSSHAAEAAPRIYNAPEGGLVVESRAGNEMLTLLIEGRIGIIVRSSDDFQINAEFNITPHSINELVARYTRELELLFSGPER